MSREGDIIFTLKEMLTNYDESNHKAIIDTFLSMIEDGWSLKDTIRFLESGRGISKTADDEIQRYVVIYSQ